MGLINPLTEATERSERGKVIEDAKLTKAKERSERGRSAQGQHNYTQQSKLAENHCDINANA